MVSRALALLAPSPTESENYRRLVKNMLDIGEFLTRDEWDELEVGLHSTQGKTDLKLYVTALRKVKVCYAALNPSIQQFLALELSAIEHDIAEATAMSEHTDLVQRVGGAMVRRRRPSGHPANKSARRAVQVARFLLEQRGCELTTDGDPRPQTPGAVMSPGPLDQTPRARTRHFFSTRQLSPAALSEPQTLAAAFIDTKGPIEAR